MTEMKSYHGRASKWLDSEKVDLVNEEIRERKLSAHMEIGFNKRQLAHRDVYRWVLRWVRIRGLFVMENGHVVKVAEISWFR
jgi:hypothetical protein